MLTVLGGLAEFERELIRARTTEGRARAKARGVSLGRRPKLTTHQQHEARERRANGEAVREIARSYNVHHSTVSRLGTLRVENATSSNTSKNKRTRPTRSERQQ
jgi:DNA invertase Pin-like site-specific DNA recombinase